MTKNPFYMLNLAAESMATIHEFRVDRETELSLCRNAILERHHNILLYGERGIGKTFLIRLLEDELKEQNDVFCIRIQLSALHAYGRDNEATSFSRAILLQLCAEIWRRLLKKPYLELRERLDESGQEVTIRDDAERVVQRVYTHLMFSIKKARFDIQNMVGFSAGAKGEKKEIKSFEGQQSEVLPFEFSEFVDELITRVTRPAGINRIILLCDDANLLPVYKQEDLLEHNLELFSSRRVQFLFSAGIYPWEAKPYQPNSFETSFELKGFSAKDHISELISKINTSSVEFSQEAIDLLFEVFRGHPRFTLSACQNAYEYVMQSLQKSITARIIHRVCEEMRIRRDEDERRIKELRNFK